MYYLYIISSYIIILLILMDYLLYFSLWFVLIWDKLRPLLQELANIVQGFLVAVARLCRGPLQHLLSCRHHCITHRFLCLRSERLGNSCLENDIQRYSKHCKLWLWFASLLGSFVDLTRLICCSNGCVVSLRHEMKEIWSWVGIPIEVAVWGKVSTLLLCCYRLVFARIYCNSFLSSLNIKR